MASRQAVVNTSSMATIGGAMDRGFVAEQPSFPLHACREAGERAIGADDAVAGDDDGKRVTAIGGADGASLVCPAEPPGLLAVGHRAAEGDRAKDLPGGALERRAGRIEGKIKGCPQASEICLQLLRGCPEDQRGGRCVGGRFGSRERRSSVGNDTDRFLLPAHTPQAHRGSGERERPQRGVDGRAGKGERGEHRARA